MREAFPPLSLLEKCSTLKSLKAIHGQLIALALIRYTYITSRILAFSAIHDLHHARRIFNRIPQPTIFNWNTMIKGHAHSSNPQSGLSVYRQMRLRCVDPNMHTFPVTIKACSHLSSLSQIHVHIFKHGFDLDLYVTSSLIREYSNSGRVDLAASVFDERSNRNTVCWTSLISGYCSNGLVDRARELFDAMPERNEVSWSAMVTGYVQNERYQEAIELFRDSRCSGTARTNVSLLVSALGACAASGASEEGRRIHAYVDEEGMEYELKLGTALVDFHAKCGSVVRAREVFEGMTKKDVMAWSAMIMGLALNGDAQSATEMFSLMLKSKITPNAVTFIGVLTACNHGGLVNQGWVYFEDMRKVYGVSPTIEHYGCMVDLLSRAGETSEAARLISSMAIEPDGALWGALLNGCILHGHVELGEFAGRLVIESDPRHCGRYVGLANVFATMGSWERVAKVRRVMRERRVTTTPGWSLIEVNGVGHRFLVCDGTHPQLKEVYRMLGDLNLELESSTSC